MTSVFGDRGMSGESSQTFYRNYVKMVLDEDLVLVQEVIDQVIG